MRWCACHRPHWFCLSTRNRARSVLGRRFTKSNCERSEGNSDFREQLEQHEQLGGKTPIFQGSPSCSSLDVLSNLMSNFRTFVQLSSADSPRRILLDGVICGQCLIGRTPSLPASAINARPMFQSFGTLAWREHQVIRSISIHDQKMRCPPVRTSPAPLSGPRKPKTSSKRVPGRERH
jgi:hypothetical protein